MADNTEKLNKLSLILEKNNINRVSILHCSNIEFEHIYKLWTDGIKYEPTTLVEMHYLAHYYRKVEKNYDLMKLWYEKAIEQHYTPSMVGLGYYYYEQKSYTQMKKYYLQAIALGDSFAMNNLAYYYQHVEKNNAEMTKYYLQAIELGHEMAISNYFDFIKKSPPSLDGLRFLIKYYKKHVDEYLTKIIKNYEQFKNNELEFKNILVDMDVDLNVYSDYNLDAFKIMYIKDLKRFRQIEKNMKSL